MSDIQQRDYYKLFTGSNETEGFEKIHLGFEGYTSEIILKKDTATNFHAPFFAPSQKLIDSTLIADGAIAGPIPALADRIFKKQSDYGDTTPWGKTTQIPDGTWLCSWLYAVSSERPMWMDRYYDPGRLTLKEVLEGKLEQYQYVTSLPPSAVYYDIPSEMTLDGSVLYQYYHQGEETAQKIVNTFSGPDLSKLRLNIDRWTENTKDDSIFNNTVVITQPNVNWFEYQCEPGCTGRDFLRFDNTDLVECKVLYDPSYNLTDEFTVTSWIRNENWSTATSTQFVGNLQKGGFGIFYNNLETIPFFAITETNYGHLYFYNQDGNLYLEKNIQAFIGVSLKPIVTNVNSENQTIVLEETSQKVFKYDHLGNVIAQTRQANGDLYTIPGIPKDFIIDINDSVWVTSTSGTFIFDQDLILKQSLLNQPYIQNETLTFDINGNLVRELSSVDTKFDKYNQKWKISTDGNLYCDTLQLTGIENQVLTNLAIDPNNDLWVLAQPNIIYKFDTFTKTLKQTFYIGAQYDFTEIKNISFIKEYNRDQDKKTWYAYIVHSDEKLLYKATLNGIVVSTDNLLQKLNILDPGTALQDPQQLTFTTKGDFTGYEWKRIFNKIKYENKPQLQFKLALKPPINTLPPLRYVLSVPVEDLNNKSWYLVVGTLKNGEISLFLNNQLKKKAKLPINYNVVYTYKHDMFIGAPNGITQNLNKELQTKSLQWNGFIDTIRIYDYAIDFEKIVTLLREKIASDDITWNISTAPLQYIEVIDQFFKHRFPGHKSQFFKIKISGLKTNDPILKKQIEEEVRLAVLQTKPGYTELLQVEWLD